MKLRLLCSSCRASFVVTGDPLPAIAACPECGKAQRLPSIEAQSTARQPKEVEAPGISVFIPSGLPVVEAKRNRGWRTYATIFVSLSLIASVLVAWPGLKDRFWKSEPKDPVERVARSYLDALIREDTEDAHRLGTVEEPPAIQSFGEVTRVTSSNKTLRGKFGPIAKLNKQIDAKFSFDPKIGRFTPKNPLGPAAVVLDTLHEAKEAQDKSGITDRLVGGNEQENLDAAVEFGAQQSKMLSKLVEGVLAPKQLIPTYSMLVNDAKPALPATEKELALNYGENHETWDALLKRPFMTLRADGPYVLDHAEVMATVRDKLASLGDPPSTLRLKLVRFQLEGIDTGWKVVSAQRASEEEPLEELKSPSDPAISKRYSSSRESSEVRDSLGDDESKK